MTTWWRRVFRRRSQAMGWPRVTVREGHGMTGWWRESEESDLTRYLAERDADDDTITVLERTTTPGQAKP